jgi:hypothetical protein
LVALAGITASRNSSASALVLSTTESTRYGASPLSVCTTHVDVSSTLCDAATVNVTPSDSAISP